MKQATAHKKLTALRCAFPYSLPVFAGYGFLGIAYGVYMTTSGFAFYYPIITAFIVFGGSLEFVIVSMLLSAFAPIQTFAMAFMIQARHLFYGLSMLDKYKDMGKKKWYLIYGLTDETFSINCTVDVPDGVDKGWFYFFMSLLDQFYWVLGTACGALLGNILTFDTTGLDFVMTSMFVVILMEQWFKDKKHASAYIGLVASVGCLAMFGSDSFMIPTMICVLVMLAVGQKPIENALEESVSDVSLDSIAESTEAAEEHPSQEGGAS